MEAEGRSKRWDDDDGCTYSEGPLEGDEVSLDAVNGCVRDYSAAVLEHRCDVHGFPFDWDFGCREDVLDSLRDLRANAIAFDQCDCIFSLSITLAFYLLSGACSRQLIVARERIWGAAGRSYIGAFRTLELGDLILRSDSI